MACLTEQQLRGLAEDALPEAEARALAEHLEQCTSCHELLHEWRANFAYLGEMKALLPKASAARGENETVEAHADWAALLDGLASGSPLPDDIPGYRILREIHRGGQGVVYQAIQESTQRKVAVKVMLDGPLAGERARVRFEREVKLVAGFKHPNIVVVHDSGLAAGRRYYAMDHVRGVHLDEFVRSKHLAARGVVRLFSQACDAVSYAHRRGVVHRDLKPSNVLVTEDGNPCVLDFGLAKVTARQLVASQDQAASESGQLLGTLSYMAPEQTFGDPDAIDVRTDVYALGVILYELLTGKPPYETKGDITTAIQNIREKDPPRPSKLADSKISRGVNTELEAVILKAMEKEPARRYQSASELTQDLNAWLEGRPVQAKSASSLYLLRKIARRHSFETAVVSTLILTIVSFSAIAAFYHTEALEALEKQAVSDQAAWQAYREKIRFAEETESSVLPAVRDQGMGWFLLFWDGGDTAEAGRVRDQTSPEAPEYAVMSFLLDETYPAERLRQELPEDARALMHFAIGERARKAGRTQDAIRAYELSMEFPGGEWLESAAQARIKKLRSGVAMGGE